MHHVAEGASAQINIIVKPRDSNNVLPEHTNDFSIRRQPDYEKNLIKSQDSNVYGHVVKDYSYGAVTPNSWSDDVNLHMRFNEVGLGADIGQTTASTASSPRPYWKNNAIDDGHRDKNHLRFNEIDDDIKPWGNTNNQDYNGLDWEPFGDTLDYPNNQANPKVSVLDNDDSFQVQRGGGGLY